MAFWTTYKRKFSWRLVFAVLIYLSLNFQISRLIGKSAKICLQEICFVFVSMKMNPLKVFVEFVIQHDFNFKIEQLN